MMENHSLSHLDAVLFDFDGVILDSVHVKTEAFAAMFRQYGPEIEDAVIAYHLAHGGVSRYKKFQYFYTKLLNLPIDQKKLFELGREFNSLVYDRVLSAPFVPGAVKILERLKKDGIPAFVVSGAPDEEVKLIVEKRGLSQFFKEVHGSPRQKDAIVRDIADRHGFRLHLCLFVGDAMTDYKAASACGTRFLGIVKEDERSPFPAETWVSNGFAFNG